MNQENEKIDRRIIENSTIDSLPNRILIDLISEKKRIKLDTTKIFVNSIIAGNSGTNKFPYIEIGTINV